MAKVTFLGTGTSIGVPVPTCTCAACRSTDLRDDRLRASVLIETGDQTLLIDCGPDFRQQALRHRIKTLSAVLLTHIHFDHCAGLDDLRIYSYWQKLPLYAEPWLAQLLRAKYDYIFSKPYPGVPHIALHEMDFEPFHIGSVEVCPIRLMHGSLPIVGYRVDNLAYLTDCTAISPEHEPRLYGIDTLIIDALRWHEHQTHFSVGQALDVVERLKPRATWFTHMSHEIGPHATAETQLAEVLQRRGLPSGSVHFAYDGLVVAYPD